MGHLLYVSAIGNILNTDPRTHRHLAFYSWGWGGHDIPMRNIYSRENVHNIILILIRPLFDI